MTDNPYSAAMERAQKEATKKGHDLGEWKAKEDGKGYRVVCNRCGGELTISGDKKLFLIGADPYMSLDFCPGDNPELMKAIDKEWSRQLAKCYAFLLRKATERRARERASRHLINKTP